MQNAGADEVGSNVEPTVVSQPMTTSYDIHSSINKQKGKQLSIHQRSFFTFTEIIIQSKYHGGTRLYVVTLFKFPSNVPTLLCESPFWTDSVILILILTFRSLICLIVFRNAYYKTKNLKYSKRQNNFNRTQWVYVNY